MKVFLSSVIRGMESYREAAAQAVRTFRYEIIQSEAFGARPDSPQRACLADVRSADVVVLILGGRYGPKQPSGLSATHEEYREAKDRCPILAFVQTGIEHEMDQEAFLEEVRTWMGGVVTGSFFNTEELQAAVTRGLHELAVARAAGPANEGELTERARALIPSVRGFSFSRLILVVVGGPTHQVLRPTELESQDLETEIRREALTGTSVVLDIAEGTRTVRDGSAVSFEQKRAAVRLDELGSVRIVQPTGRTSSSGGMLLPALVEEDVQSQIECGLRFMGWVLDRIDPLRRLATVLPVAALADTRHLGWLTKAEFDARPSSVQLSLTASDPTIVTLSRAQPRGGLSEAKKWAEDLTVLLRREARRL